MKVIKNENIIGVDIDDTLLLWDNPTVNGPDKVAMPFAGTTVYLIPHTYHIQLLEMYNERGCYLQFWSANGWRHAERALKVLGLEHLADGENGHIQTKLSKHMDDSPDAAAILGPRVFCKDFTKPVTNNVWIPITTYDYRGNTMIIDDGTGSDYIDEKGQWRKR